MLDIAVGPLLWLPVIDGQRHYLRQHVPVSTGRRLRLTLRSLVHVHPARFCV